MSVVSKYVFSIPPPHEEIYFDVFGMFLINNFVLCEFPHEEIQIFGIPLRTRFSLWDIFSWRDLILVISPDWSFPKIKISDILRTRNILGGLLIHRWHSTIQFIYYWCISSSNSLQYFWSTINWHRLNENEMSQLNVMGPGQWRRILHPSTKSRSSQRVKQLNMGLEYMQMFSCQSSQYMTTTLGWFRGPM